MVSHLLMEMMIINQKETSRIIKYNFSKVIKTVLIMLKVRPQAIQTINNETVITHNLKTVIL